MPGTRPASASRFPARIIILLGTHAQYGHSPPTSSASTPTTSSPSSASVPATCSPPGPIPITTTSTCSAIAPHLSHSGPALGLRPHLGAYARPGPAGRRARPHGGALTRRVPATPGTGRGERCSAPCAPRPGPAPCFGSVRGRGAAPRKGRGELRDQPRQARARRIGPPVRRCLGRLATARGRRGADRPVSPRFRRRPFPPVPPLPLRPTRGQEPRAESRRG